MRLFGDLNSTAEEPITHPFLVFELLKSPKVEDFRVENLEMRNKAGECQKNSGTDNFRTRYPHLRDFDTYLCVMVTVMKMLLVMF